jgi:4-hydroxybenzoyl-CoA reductase subunit alpha
VKAAMVDTGTITVKGTYTCPVEFQGDKKIRGSAIGATMGFCYAAQVVEVEVDELTGKVTVPKVWVAVDVGRALNPLSVEGQIQGGVWMGLGQACPRPRPSTTVACCTATCWTIACPTIVESPDIEVFIVESIDPNGPFGAKEASEGMLAGILPALARRRARGGGRAFCALPAVARPHPRPARHAERPPKEGAKK